jgi:hypothetical protein
METKEPGNKMGVLQMVGRFKIAGMPLGPVKVQQTPLDPVISQQIKYYCHEPMQWQQIISSPSIVLILGRRGSGKSALGYRLLEYFRYTLSLYVVALPRSARRLIPDWIGCVPSLGDIPPKSIALIDEAYTQFHSRSFSEHKSRILSELINLSRQRELTLIFVTQEARQIDRNIASSANVVIVKDPSILQLEFERKELRNILAEAKKMFVPIGGKERNGWSYVYAPESNTQGMIENSLPSFWSPHLSKAFLDTNSVGQMIYPRKISTEEKMKKAKELRRQRFSLGQIAKTLGIAKATVKNYLDDYPYRKKRIQ